MSVCDVSVVVPTRNRPEMLKRSVGSALRQVGVDLEVVVIIDGEDAVSEVALQEFRDSRVRWLNTGMSVGGAEARNIGVRAAHGRFIALLDDDDEWLPEKLQLQMSMAERSCNDVFVVTTQYLYRREGYQDEVWPGHLPAKGEPASEFLFSSAGGFQTSTYLGPRDVFLKSPFDPRLKRHQDWDWFLRLSQQPEFRLLVVERPLSVYWVPVGRDGISRKIDWRYSLDWIESVRHRITAKAYAAFLVRICLRGAMLRGESLREICFLMRKIVVCGGLTPLLTLHVIVGLTVPEAMRTRICDWKQRYSCWSSVLQLTWGAIRS